MVKEVDDRVQEVFASAYADTAREFEQLFARLFPGGEGSLVLTEPDDMLATGIEIEARPPGKKVKRLSLLSGGERSLTAIAYLFAIFKARPSPFYVLDEVEAALDDTNLQRLLGVFDELRESSQLIVITHQRRTMEAADALYGITMRGDGVSTVISQRIASRQPAEPSPTLPAVRLAYVSSVTANRLMTGQQRRTNGGLACSRIQCMCGPGRLGAAARIGAGIARGAALVAGLTIVSRLLGLVRTLVFSQTVGASCLGTAYVTANQVPNLLYELVLGGALTSAMVPVLARSAERAADDPADRRRGQRRSPRRC